MFDGVDASPRLFVCQQDALPYFLVRVRPHLEKMAAASGGRFAADDIEALIVSGRFQLWIILDGLLILCALVTEIIQYPQTRALRMVGLVGFRWRRWAHLLAELESVAKDEIGCQLMEAMHQPGHERMLNTPGWRVFHFLSEKVL